MSGFTYAKAGVDIDKKGQSVENLVNLLRFKRKGKFRPLNLKGHFAGGVEFGRHVLVLSTDGVGTKLLIAKALNKWDTVGIDCVAMNVDDVLCIGAEPVAFVDYIATPVVDVHIITQIAIGLNEGARRANVTIVGGETAVMKDVVCELDLSGTALGIVEKKRIITGRKIKPGDVIVGFPSSGIHSNGYTLVRKIFEEKGIGYTDIPEGFSRRIGEVLLEPTRIYVKDVLPLLDKYNIHGMAHITGGGLRNLVRLHPEREFRITDPLPVPEIFRYIQELGNVEHAEMYQTFNMGMGFSLITQKKDAEAIVKETDGKIVGEVRKGKGVTLPALGIHFTAY
ncbi:MAG: phosphoribosylformylglycinamidine cyclo-ligase [Thermoplasmata archaeon]|nr:phosphoribosylformylglycinamidine cyclo-ligase [Thermoplasmata archaeon]